LVAERLARQISDEIVRQGWPVGDAIGSEAQLMARYGVGRYAIRETVRILENNGVARRRPGPGGGLIVTAPQPDAILQATRLFLDHRGVTPAHLIEAWTALEVAAVGDVATTIDVDGIERLRRLVQLEGEVGPEYLDYRQHNVHLEIARLARNPALELFLQVILELTLAHGISPIEEAAARWLHERHRRIVDAICAGDAPLAQFETRKYLERLGELGAIQEQPTGPPAEPAAEPRRRQRSG
jgi:DNA-binding FadR family transcriptional regulator